MEHEQTYSPVTRLEILDAIEGAFTAPPVTKSEILTSAEDTGARPELVAALQELPDEPYTDVRDLWEHLPRIPVDA
ncbi:hypothetical protein GCM10027174_43430 [Salinifilum aidingensis]